MKIRHHWKTTEERMSVYYDDVEKMAEHHKQMILDGWQLDLEKMRVQQFTVWVRFTSETFVKEIQ